MRTTRLLFALSIAGSLFCTTNVEAQKISDSPYKGLESAKGVWPPYYRPDPSDAMYTQMMANGWCKPNGWRAQEYYKSKMVDVNALPESSFSGVIKVIEPGKITAFDEKHGTTMSLIVHNDAKISNVGVHGKASKDELVPGAFVRFVGQVDENGNVAGALDQIELAVPDKLVSAAITPGQVQNLFGTIQRREGDQLILGASAGKIRRLTVTLAPQVEVTVRITDYTRVNVGDPVTAKGRLYRGAASKTDAPLLFSDELDIAVQSLAKVKAPTRPGVVANTK
jgi:hypothetical protein